MRHSSASEKNVAPMMPKLPDVRAAVLSAGSFLSTLRKVPTAAPTPTDMPVRSPMRDCHPGLRSRVSASIRRAQGVLSGDVSLWAHATTSAETLRGRKCARDSGQHTDTSRGRHGTAGGPGGACGPAVNACGSRTGHLSDSDAKLSGRRHHPLAGACVASVEAAAGAASAKCGSVRLTLVVCCSTCWRRPSLAWWTWSG